MMQKLQAGDWVSINDVGLNMLMKFKPADAKPINIGKVVSIADGGYAEIEFPIGDDKMSEHSQISFYHLSDCTKIDKPDYINE